MITIINYGLGNLGSISNMLKKIGVEAKITSETEEILKAKKIILPGVGAYDAAMKRIDELKWREVLIQKARIEKIPFLGICLGMQLLTRGSEEGVRKGLDLVPADTVRFSAIGDLKIPHMGWNYVRRNTQSLLTSGFTEEYRFYFVHSFKVVCDDSKYSILKTNYGGDFDSAVQNENVFGTQFHPEKSHKYGMELLMNFSKL